MINHKNLNKVKLIIGIKDNGMPRIGTFIKRKTIKLKRFPNSPRCKLCKKIFESNELKYVGQFCHICLTCAAKNILIQKYTRSNNMTKNEELIKYYKNELWEQVTKLNTTLAEAASSNLLVKLTITDIATIGEVQHCRIDYQIFTLI